MNGPQGDGNGSGEDNGDGEALPTPADAAVPPQPHDPPRAQPRNPLHGLTLQALLTELVAHYGWPELGQRIPVRCFTSDPSIASSLKFLRKTPWAREKVESLYLCMQREIKRAGRGGVQTADRF